MDDYIQLPNDVNSAKNAFFGIGGFPGVVGAIDGTHIWIQEPKTNANAFINRKYYPSINVYAVCDTSQKFTFASIRWPGSCHDSFILRQTNLWDQYEQNRRNGLILGDSRYPCGRWLLTPYIQPGTPAQQAFNRALARTRTVLECSFGRLKRRFRRKLFSNSSSIPKGNIWGRSTISFIGTPSLSCNFLLSRTFQIFVFLLYLFWCAYPRSARGCSNTVDVSGYFLPHYIF